MPRLLLKKIFLAGTFFVLSCAALAQGAQYTNLTARKPTSNTVYSGIVNKLLLAPAIKPTKASADRAEVSMINDTLIVIPSEPGVLKVTLTMDGNVEELTLQCRPLPEFQLILDGHPEGRIRVSKFQPSQRFKLVWHDSDDYWADYRVERFFAVIGTYNALNDGPSTSPELVSAVKKAPKGSILNITMVFLANDIKGTREQHRTSFKYTIN